jgi:hypothetical protein
VAAVNVEVPDVELLIETEDEERLHVVGLVALEGSVVIAQESVTVPENEFDDVTVMVAVPLEPALTLMLPLLAREKLVPLASGDCQKFPQPARSGAAASINRANLPIFIAAPLARFPAAPFSSTRIQATAYERICLVAAQISLHAHCPL